jgi:hypothetical protein
MHDVVQNVYGEKAEDLPGHFRIGFHAAAAGHKAENRDEDKYHSENLCCALDLGHVAASDSSA